MSLKDDLAKRKARKESAKYDNARRLNARRLELNVQGIREELNDYKELGLPVPDYFYLLVRA